MGRLLLIDDDASTLEWMQPALVAAGHDVRLAANAGEALRLLQRWTPDLVLADVLMPDVSGWAYAELVRTHHLPVLFVSVVRGEAEAVLRGATGLVRKPVSPRRLRSVVAEALGRHAGARNRVLLVDDDDDLRGVFRHMLEQDVTISEARDGVEALAILGSQPVQAIVTDVHMPRMGGLELVRWLRSDPRFRTLPVIVVSSDRVQAEAPVWRELGVERSMTKDQFIAWLLARIDERLVGTHASA